MSIKRLYISLILTIFATQMAQSQECTLTESSEQKIYFREAYRYVDSAYRNNNLALNNLKSTIDSAQTNGTLLSVEIQAWASPDGSVQYNELLAKNRTNELAKWIMGNCNVAEEQIKMTSGGIGWHILCEMLVESDLPYKESIIDIIENTPLWVKDSHGNIITGRRKKLMEHNYGRTWRDMETRLFPEIRCGLAVVVNVRKEEPARIEEVDKNEKIEEAGVIEQPVTTIITEVADTTENAVAPAVVGKQAEEASSEKPFYMAVKSNLLEDVLLVPNIGVEFYLGSQWSVGANWKYAWWSIDSKSYFWRVYGGDVYVRKYFGSKAKKKPLQGHHVGIYAQAVTYDFELGGKGIMGGVPGGNIFDKMNYGAGVEYGYSLPIAKRLNMDFSIGFGYLGGQYQEYKPMDDCYVWQATKHRHYWGPTKAEISLVWLLGRDNVNAKKGGAK